MTLLTPQRALCLIRNVSMWLTAPAGGISSFNTLCFKHFIPKWKSNCSYKNRKNKWKWNLCWWAVLTFSCFRTNTTTQNCFSGNKTSIIYFHICPNIIFYTVLLNWQQQSPSWLWTKTGCLSIKDSEICNQDTHSQFTDSHFHRFSNFKSL